MGSILNDFLDVAHNGDGTLQTNAVSSAGAELSSNKGKANGYATLDGTSNVPASQLDNAVRSLNTLTGDVSLTSADNSVTITSSGSQVDLHSGSGNVPNPTTSSQTIISNGSDNWSLATAATVDTADTPQPDTELGSPGTSPHAAAADHSHPLGTLGRAMSMGVIPPQYTVDVTFDGTTSITGVPCYPYKGTQGFSLSGSTYTLSAMPFNGPAAYWPTFKASNITVNAGVTLTSQTPGYGMVLIASDTLTIDGTIDISGAAGSGATGGLNGQTNWHWVLSGGPGGNGSTGAGAGGQYPNPSGGTVSGLGGGGGSGGASGATAGGGGTGPAPYSTISVPLTNGLPFLYTGLSTNGNGMTPAPGGAGGGGGAGDGTNAGGGGGSGAGNLILIAPNIVIGSTAVIKANGGAGAPGTGGNAGGGGGGGGGVISVQGLSISIASGATIQASGGSGGAAAGTGSAGNAGGASQCIADPSTSIGGYGFGDGVMICRWQ